MSEKKIIIAKYGINYCDSDLDYYQETSQMKTRLEAMQAKLNGANFDQTYIMFRNAVSSVNTYSVIETSIEKESNTIAVTFYFNNYPDWDHNIFQFAKYFKKAHAVYPNILLGNERTIETIDLFMSKKLMKEGRESEIKNISRFSTSEFDLEVCIDFDLEDHRFTLVFDSQAEFITKPENENLDEMS